MEIGSIVAGKYRIDRLIGEGGMGTVVAATHLQLGTQLALKFLNDQIKTSVNSLERFTREARACAQLRSEHVCKVSDFGMAEGLPYLAMELLDGSDLAKLRDGGPLDVATAADYILQACAGIAEAHAMGIVHRDLKPHNLFLARRADGSPLIKVLDFGIAKIPVGDDFSITQTSSVLGSPGYMAPEQLRSTKSVDARAEVWALGVILYELAAGRHPFKAEAVTEITLKIAMDDPPPLVEAPALQAVVSRCLEKEPDARYPNVGALADALAPHCERGREWAAIVHKLLGGSAVTGESRRSAPAFAMVSRPPADSTVDASPKPRRAAAGAANLGDAATVAMAGDVMPPSNVATVAMPEPGTGKRKSKLLWGMLALALVGGAAVVVVLAVSRPSEPAPSPPSGGSVVQKIEPTPATVPPTPSGSAAAGPAAASVASGSAPSSPPPVALASLEIVIKGAYDPIVSVDGVVWGEGRKIAREVSLGKHHIEIKVSGRPTITKDIELEGPRTITIEVPPAKRVAAVKPAAGSGSDSTQPPSRADAEQEAAKRKAELIERQLQTIRTTSIPMIVVGACQHLAALDSSVVPWEKCVVAQCSVHPQAVNLMITRAPLQLHHGLRNLCPASAPGKR